MPFVKGKILDGITCARSADGGKTVVLGVHCRDGSNQAYGISPDSIIELVARLLEAWSEAVADSKLPPAKIATNHTQVESAQGKLAMTLFLTPTLGLPFSLTPALADELSAQLAKSAAELRPRRPPLQN